MITEQHTPLISVVMPVYNAGSFLQHAIESILSQSFKDFEFIIIDDCSEDESREVVQAFSDPRIKFYINEHNQGVAKTLNKGLSLANGLFIARMDGDDISEHSRFARQVKFMERYPELVITGSWVTRMDDTKSYLLRYPVDRDCVKSFLLFGNPLAHPSVFMRRKVIQGLDLCYDPNCPAAQDFELWSRCWNTCAMDNFPKPLVRWRCNRSGVTMSSFDTSNQVSKIRAAILLFLALR